MVATRRIGKILGGIALMACLVLAAQAVPSPTQAIASTEDIAYDFLYDGSGNHDWTPYGIKEDTSPVYMGVTTKTVYDAWIIVDGAFYQGGSWYDATVNGPAHLLYIGDWAIHSVVYEMGMQYARLCGGSAYVGIIEGEWSPDSAYWHPSLN